MSASTRPNSVSPLIVGRVNELDILHANLAAALAGNGRLILIAGDAGIGKTALAEALCAEGMERGAMVLSGHAYDLTETPPYGPWQELFRQYPASPDLPDLPPFFTANSTSEPIHSQAALFARIRDFLRDAATRTPLVLMLDDIQWADPGSLELLRILARDLAGSPVLLVATYRAGELETEHPLAVLLPLLVREAHAARITLRPLDDAAVRTLIVARYGALGDDASRLVAYLRAHAEGNPFFIGELLHALEDDGRLVRVGATWVLGDLTQTRVPPLLRQVIEGRINRLGAPAQRLLAVAAVIGQEAPIALWQAASGADEETLLDLVERAVAAQVLTETAGGAAVTFAHALIRETLYEGLLGARRRAWHVRIAEALIALPEPDPDAVAYHLGAAGDARVGDWLVRAGERADAADAYRTADARFTDALTFLTKTDGDRTLRCELLLRLGRLRRQRDPVQSVRFLEEAAHLAQEVDDSVLVGAALFRLGNFRAFAGDRQRGLAQMAEGLRALDAFPEEAVEAKLRSIDIAPALVASRHSLFALRAVEVGRLAEAERHAEHALAVSADGLTYATVNAWDTLRLIAYLIGHPEKALQRADAEWTFHRTVAEHDSACWIIASELFWTALVYGTDDREYLARLRTELDSRSPEPGEVFSVLPMRVMHLPAWYIEGAWAEAREAARQVQQTRFATHPFTQIIPIVLGRILVAQGETDAAWSLVQAAFPTGVSTEPGDNRFVTSAALQCIAAALALDTGNLTEAHAWLEAHDRWLAWSGAVLGRAEGDLLWARYHALAGDDEQADAWAEQALRHAAEPRQPLTLLAAHRWLGERATAAGQHEEADRHLDAALALAAACHAPYERALTLLALAERRAASGDSTTAQALLDEASTLLAPLGARPALARASLLAAQVASGAAPAALPYPDGLTERETEVLRLVASGKSNREIAQALGITARTAERHISNIYTKIGAGNRVEAAAYAVRHALL